MSGEAPATPDGAPAIETAPYDPEWPARFEALRQRLEPALGELVTAVEHVGSTAVPGLGAKPIIDIDVVLRDARDLPAAIVRLTAMGYRHEGNLGIAGREAFARPPGTVPHHLYVLAADAAELARHLAFRDELRASPAARCAYARLKRQLARTAAGDRALYSQGKGAFVAEVLAEARRRS